MIHLSPWYTGGERDNDKYFFRKLCQKLKQLINFVKPLVSMLQIVSLASTPASVLSKHLEHPIRTYLPLQSIIYDYAYKKTSNHIFNQHIV